MQETVLEVLIFIIDNPFFTIFMAFVTGFLATRCVAVERRPGTIGFVIIGLIGFFLGRFGLTYFEFNEVLDGLRELRFVIDLVASFAGSFAVASLVHFIRPR
jgi:uncharacterized membrane protein YeaQ/YmgE (transglycosylase-associated protein family)